MRTAVKMVVVFGSLAFAGIPAGRTAAQSSASGNSAIPAVDLIPNLEDVGRSQSFAWLLGDWNGRRTQLQKLGVDFQLGYISEFAHNATGGVKSKSAYTDQYTAGATLNLERLFGVHDATFQVTFTERTGHHLGDDAGLGTLQLVQEVFGRGQTARLTQFWFDQKYFDGAIDWKLGRMTYGEDYASFSCNFQNLTFCGAPPGKWRRNVRALVQEHAVDQLQRLPV